MLVLVVLMVLMVLMVSVVMLQVEVSLYWVLSVLTGISDMSFM